MERCVREAQHLSQEALAEAAGITVRTVQRFEAGETVQIGSRRSLAKALGYGDQDIFDDPKFAATVLGFFDDLRAIQQKQVDDQHPDQTRLPAQLVSSGEQAIRFDWFIYVTMAAFGAVPKGETINNTSSCSTSLRAASNDSAFSVSTIAVAQNALVELSSRQAGKLGFKIDFSAHVKPTARGI